LLKRFGTLDGTTPIDDASDVSWSLDGTRIAVGTTGYFVHIFDANNYVFQTSVVMREYDVDAVIWSRDNQLAVVISKKITIYDGITYQKVIAVDYDGIYIHLLEWQDEYLAVAGSHEEIVIWNTTQWEISHKIVTNDAPIISISWKPNSTVHAYWSYTSSTITLIETVSSQNTPIDSFVEWLRETVRAFSP
jgi:WD40 repeat protein